MGPQMPEKGRKMKKAKVVEKKTCADCGKKAAKSSGKMSGGKFYCGGCK
jgi:formylmethanofuran dehydrogenase subunit E